MARLGLKLALLALATLSLSGCIIYSGDKCDDFTSHTDAPAANETPAPVASSSTN